MSENNIKPVIGRRRLEKRADVIAFVAPFSLPLGVGAAVYLEEYAKDNFLRRLIEMNISNLAGVASIVYGLLGLGLFVSLLGMPHWIVILGSFTLTLRVLSIMIGAATTIFTAPRGLFSSFSAMPLQIFAWSDFPSQDFQHGVVPAAIAVLLVVLLSMNGIVIYIRHRYLKKRR